MQGPWRFGPRSASHRSCRQTSSENGTSLFGKLARLSPAPGRALQPMMAQKVHPPRLMATDRPGRQVPPLTYRLHPFQQFHRGLLRKNRVQNNGAGIGQVNSAAATMFATSPNFFCRARHPDGGASESWLSPPAKAYLKFFTRGWVHGDMTDEEFEAVAPEYRRHLERVMHF